MSKVLKYQLSELRELRWFIPVNGWCQCRYHLGLCITLRGADIDDARWVCEHHQPMFIDVLYKIIKEVTNYVVPTDVIALIVLIVCDV